MGIFQPFSVWPLDGGGLTLAYLVSKGTGFAGVFFFDKSGYAKKIDGSKNRSC